MSITEEYYFAKIVFADNIRNIPKVLKIYEINKNLDVFILDKPISPTVNSSGRGEISNMVVNNGNVHRKYFV